MIDLTSFEDLFASINYFAILWFVNSLSCVIVYTAVLLHWNIFFKSRIALSISINRNGNFSFFNRRRLIGALSTNHAQAFSFYTKLKCYDVITFWRQCQRKYGIRQVSSCKLSNARIIRKHWQILYWRNLKILIDI